MEDKEIIKALECCASECFNACDNCPFYKQCENDEQLSKFALDLINRQQAEKEALIAGQETMSKYIEDQQAEIERLKAHEEKEHQYCKNVCEPKYKEEVEWLKKLLAEEEAKYTKCAKRFYKEGIKDFAKRLKDYYINHKRYKRLYAHTLIDVFFDVIDNLAKEMVGDNNV